MRLEHFNISGPMDLLEEVRDFYVHVVGLREGAMLRIEGAMPS